MLFSRIHLPAGDPNRITSPTQVTPYFAKGVNEAYYKFLKDEIAQQQTDEGRNLTTTRENYLHGIKGQFSTSSMMNVDAQGDERFNNFRTFVLSEEAKAVKEGHPFDLYNYKSPNYISNKIPSFQASLDEQIRHLSDRLRQTAPPAKGAAATAPYPTVPQMTATNPATNEKLISTDGGKTWQKP